MADRRTTEGRYAADFDPDKPRLLPMAHLFRALERDQADALTYVMSNGGRYWHESEDQRWLDKQAEAHRAAATEGHEKLSAAVAELRELRGLAREFLGKTRWEPCSGVGEAERAGRIIQQAGQFTIDVDHIRWARAKGFDVEPHPERSHDLYLLLQNHEHGVECDLRVSADVYELALIDSLVTKAGTLGSAPALAAVRSLLAEPEPADRRTCPADMLRLVFGAGATRAKDAAAEQREHGDPDRDAGVFEGIGRLAQSLCDLTEQWGGDEVEIRRMPASAQARSAGEVNQ
jgi:hypothetical protein